MEVWLVATMAVGCIFIALLICLILFLGWRLHVVRQRNALDSKFRGTRHVVHPRSPPVLIWETESPGSTGGRRMFTPPKPVFPHLELLKRHELADSSDTDSETSNATMNGLDTPPDGYSSQSPSPSPPGKESPLVEFTLEYVSETSILNVHLIRVVSLPARYREHCSSFVKVSLLARKKSSQQTHVQKKSRNPEYDQNFTFPGFTLLEVKQCTVVLTVYVKKFNFLKDKKIGVLFFPLFSLDIVPDVPVTCLEKLNRPPKKKTAAHKTGELGQLFVLLQYQASADRLKVLVRKAENLPRPSGMSLGQPEYYVIISLLKDIEAVTCKETRPAPGPNPVWNQPFLFDIPCKTASLYWLQFLVMRGKMYSRDGVVGHVLVGPDTTISGTSHWNEAMEPRASEAAKWHEICPVDVS